MTQNHLNCFLSNSGYFYVYAPFPNENFFNSKLDQVVSGNISYIAQDLFKIAILAYDETNRDGLIPHDQIGKSGNFECLLSQNQLQENDLCSWDNKILIALPEKIISQVEEVSLLEAPTFQIINNKDVGKSHGLIKIKYSPNKNNKKERKDHVRVRNGLMNSLIPYIGIKLNKHVDFYYHDNKI